jgi:microcystin degradation protein MlrC
VRIGIAAWLHESNTFVAEATTLPRFAEDLLLVGGEVAEHFAGGHHEVSGFFAALAEVDGVEAVPLAAFRALPSGVISTTTFDTLQEMLTAALAAAGPLDGLLVAAHGAAVSERHPAADAAWLSRLRGIVGPRLPLVATLDAHANLSPGVVAACTALVAYRTNPHVDQKDRGREAAKLLLAAVRGECRPVMAAAFPPLVIPIDRQGTTEPHWQPLLAAADAIRRRPGLLSASIVLGFPYADVPEMGASAIAVADGDAAVAHEAADELASLLWAARGAFTSRLVSIDDALTAAAETDVRVCLLDMGDNVGGGSAGDSTVLARELLARGLGPAFVCLHDPAAVATCVRAGPTADVALAIGGRSGLAGEPLRIRGTVRSLHAGTFEERDVRHGGIRLFDQGPTAVVDSGRLTVLLTSLRVPPFSLAQLSSCGLDPNHFTILVAKGVHAPVAAYREVCDRFIRVDTPGPTTADPRRLVYEHRRRPLFPFET